MVDIQALWKPTHSSCHTRYKAERSSIVLRRNTCAWPPPVNDLIWSRISSAPNLHRIYKWYRQRAADHYCIWGYIRDWGEYDLNYYFCYACRYCFSAEELPDRCPNCGAQIYKENPAVRLASKTEIAELPRIRKEDKEDTKWKHINIGHSAQLPAWQDASTQYKRQPESEPPADLILSH